MWKTNNFVQKTSYIGIKSEMKFSINYPSKWKDIFFLFKMIVLNVENLYA